MGRQSTVNSREPQKEEVWRCQFCEEESPSSEWVRNKCPKCKREYDPILAQKMDDD